MPTVEQLIQYFYTELNEIILTEEGALILAHYLHDHPENLDLFLQYLDATIPDENCVLDIQTVQQVLCKLNPNQSLQESPHQSLQLDSNNCFEDIESILDRVETPRIRSPTTSAAEKDPLTLAVAKVLKIAKQSVWIWDMTSIGTCRSQFAGNWVQFDLKSNSWKKCLKNPSIVTKVESQTNLFRQRYQLISQVRIHTKS